MLFFYNWHSTCKSNLWWAWKNLQLSNCSLYFLLSTSPCSNMHVIISTEIQPLISSTQSAPTHQAIPLSDEKKLLPSPKIEPYFPLKDSQMAQLLSSASVSPVSRGRASIICNPPQDHYLLDWASKKDKKLYCLYWLHKQILQSTLITIRIGSITLSMRRWITVLRLERWSIFDRFKGRVNMWKRNLSSIIRIC